MEPKKEQLERIITETERALVSLESQIQRVTELFGASGVEGESAGLYQQLIRLALMTADTVVRQTQSQVEALRQMLEAM